MIHGGIGGWIEGNGAEDLTVKNASSVRVFGCCRPPWIMSADFCGRRLLLLSCPGTRQLHRSLI